MSDDTFKIFVSLPMRGRSVEEIRRIQNDIFARVALPSWELLDTVHENETPEEGNDLWYLGRSIQEMGKADVVIFAKDWRKAHGCRVEHLICELYDIPHIYEEDARHMEDEC